MIDLTRGLQPGRVIDTVNWHITPRCGYNCRFCNIHNCYHELNGLDSINDNVQKLLNLEDRGIHIQTLNITGGDPLLHPRLFYLLDILDQEGFDVWITSNGSTLTENNVEQLAEFVSRILLPVDCISNVRQKVIGRGYGTHVSDILYVSDIIHKNGIELGVNTLVTSINCNDNLRPLIHRLEPTHWNVYQTLPGIFQNDYQKCISADKLEFSHFVRRHSHLRFGPCNKPQFWSKKDVKRGYYYFVDGKIKIN